ncbi:MAG: hypothetical protein S4CHLAM27_10810 [Chlamydiia bacterium]|nr:hypothetical protein [Chlamydiia bacterium]
MGIVFKGPVFHYALKKYVSYKIPLEGEWNLNYSYMSLRKKGVAFHDICLEDKEGGVICKIGKIFCYAPSLEKISLSNHYIIEDLDISFTKKMVSEKVLSADQMRSILLSLRQVEIKNGNIHTPDKKIGFSLAKSISSQKLGTLIFSEPLRGQIKMDLSSWADRWIIDIEARQSSIGYYKEFFDFFMGDAATDWKVENGKLDGRAFLAISAQNTIKDARFHMNFLDGKVTNNAAGITSSFDRIFVDMDYPISSEAKSIIDNVKISSSMDKGEIHVYNENGDTRFHFKDLSGFITMDAFKEAAVDITGFIDDGGKTLPVKLAGNPTKKNEQGLELDLSLQLDPMFGHMAHINVVCTHEKGEFLLRSHLDSLEVRQMLILQVCLGLFNPSLKDYTISKGNYSGDVFVAFNNGGIKEFSLRNLNCDDLGIYSSKRDIRVEAGKVSGQLEIDLFLDKKTALPSWEVDLQDGSVIIGREDGLPYHFENTNLRVVNSRGKFSESFFSSEIAGIKGRVDIDGTTLKPIFDVMVTSSGDNVLQWLSPSLHSYDNEIMISTRVEKIDDNYCAIGTLTLHQAEHSSEVAFEMITDGVTLDQVNFSSKDFSGMFYPYCNELTNFDWSIDGDFSFTGKYTKEKLCCDFSGRNATYKEEHSYIKDAKGSGRFEKDLHTNTWYVDLNLTSGKKKLMEEKNFHLKNAQLRVSSDDTYFKVRSLEGYMDLDESISRLYFDIRKFDMSKENIYHADITVHNQDFELARVAGTYKDNKVTLDENSHLLEEKIVLDVCDFSDGIKVSVESILHLDDIAFPKMIRDRKFADVFCKLSIDGFDYRLDAKNRHNTLSISGTGKDYIIAYNDVSFKGSLKEGSLHIEEGALDYAGKDIKIKRALINKESIFIDGSVSDDHLQLTGEVECFFKDNFNFKGKGLGSYTVLGNEAFKIKTEEELTFSYDKKGLVKGAKFSVTENGKDVGLFEVESIGFHNMLKKISFHGLKGVINKQVVSDKIGVNFVEEELHFSADADILPQENDFWFSGKMDKKTVVFNDQKIAIDSLTVRGNKKSLVVDCTLPVYDTIVDATGHVYFDDRIIFHIDGLSKLQKVLEIDGSYKDTLEILRIKGDLLGACFDVTPCGELGDSDYKVEAQLDFAKIKPLLSEGALEFAERMELGKGIEVIGGICLKDGFSFDGVIKGTDFDFLDYSLSSLFGKLSYKDGICHLTDFSIADRSFIANCERAIFDSRQEGCLFETKEFKVGSLRPCLLSKKGERKKITNPFMLQKVNFQDVKGNLADLNTITGKGSIAFINSFDKDTNPLFDFAKEIIGRIGLDPVLMVPVTGSLDFVLADGKMNFLKMQDAYSDQKRSYFFLWHKTPSYIDFDGNINIDIRMKQYVLFKFTELFIISLDGTLADPKVHLK